MRGILIKRQGITLGGQKGGESGREAWIFTLSHLVATNTITGKWTGWAKKKAITEKTKQNWGVCSVE